MKVKTGLPCLLVAFVIASGCATSGQKEVGPELNGLVEVERRASDAYANGRNEEAAQLYRSMVEQMPGEAEYWYRLANSLVRTGRQDDAAIAYQQTLRIDPDNAKAWHNLGIVRLRQAQASFATGVQNSSSGDRVFDESLRLSTAVFSLISPESKQGRREESATDGNARSINAGQEPGGMPEAQPGG
ncbi:tetratricopeptide repeat protein [Marilutibacter alkalisoli]|nr:tetratricopeptide repeat protein [Lysobacter alkalisoli]